MRRLAWLIFVLLVMWSAWWAAASSGVQHLLTTWLDNRRDIGWEVEVAEISKHGFPLFLHARLKDVSAADPATGLGVDAPQLDLTGAAFWPGYMSVKLPDAPIHIMTPVGHFTLQTTDAQADLRLRPSASLQLQSLSAVSEAWRIGSSDGTILSADALDIAATQDNASPETYQIDVNATNLTPGTLPRALLSLPAEWPASFDVSTADLSVNFDMPWDRSALTDRRPQPRAVTLNKLEASWGELSLLGSGDLSIDPSGIPTGTISVTVTNWREIITLVDASDALPNEQRLQMEILLGALSNLGGSQDDLTLTLSMHDGDMLLGAIRLGPAPRLIFQ